MKSEKKRKGRKRGFGFAVKEEGNHPKVSMGPYMMGFSRQRMKIITFLTNAKVIGKKNISLC